VYFLSHDISEICEVKPPLSKLVLAKLHWWRERMSIPWDAKLDLIKEISKNPIKKCLKRQHGGQKTCGFSVKDHFGLVPSYIIQSVLAMLICRRSCRTFSMNSGSTKDRHVTPSENAVY